MYRRLLTAAALAAVPLLAAGFASNAMATLELDLTDVTTGATTGNIAGTPVAGGSAINFSGGVGNWIINLTIGLSLNSAGVASIDLSSIDAKTTTADTLNVKLSDNGYSVAAASFVLGVSGTLVSCPTGTCTSTIKDFYSTTNTLFAETTQIDSTLGPFSATYGTGATGTGTSATPYSLTEDLTLASPDGVEWSTDSSISATVPEPASFTLLGSALVGLGWLGRSRRKARKGI